MKDIFKILEELKIEYHREDHAPVFTTEEAAQHVPPMKGISIKNLFLRTKKSKDFALLVVPDEKKVDLKAFGKQEAFQNPSFSNEEQLMEYLGVSPGSATILGIFHDTELKVQVYLDRAVAESEFLQCHPLVNTSTLSMQLKDIHQFLNHFQHPAKIIEVPEKSIQ